MPAVVSFMTLWAALLLAFPSTVTATTLVKRGRLQQVDSDDSSMTVGGKLESNTASGGCSTNRYFDDCPNIAGTRVYRNQNTAAKGESYILNGDSVTYCGRWRTESTCVLGDGSSTTSNAQTNYGGTTTTYQLNTKVNDIATLSLIGELDQACDGVCTNPQDFTDLRFLLDPPSSCLFSNGWTAVNDDYDEVCAVKETCDELVIGQGCEDTYRGSVAGTYRPLSPSEIHCSDSSYDATRSFYASDEGEDRSTKTYIFYDSGHWEVTGLCGLPPITAYFDATGDEPYLGAENEIRCYDGDGGYTSTPFQISCVKISGSGGGEGLGDTGSGNGGSGGIVTSGGYAALSSLFLGRVSVYFLLAFSLACAFVVL